MDSFKEMLSEMTERLDAECGHIEMRFTYFVNKKAPESGVESLLYYDVTFIGARENDQNCVAIKVVVPVTSLCPCSKKISDRGAHNQRSHVTVNIETEEFIWIEEIIDMVEAQASCELYGLLKRPDEKVVTERAYDNPKFVEDIVRDIYNVPERLLPVRCNSNLYCLFVACLLNVAADGENNSGSR